MQYDKDDLRNLPEPIEFILRRPSMYVGNQDPKDAIRKALIEEATLLGSKSVEAFESEGWTVVRADLDWLTCECDYPVTIEQLFTQICNFPEAGTNSMRPEVLATAFADDVLTCSREVLKRIKGCETLPNKAQSWLEDGAWARAIAYRI